MGKKKCQAAFVFMLVMILAFGNVDVVYAAKRDASAPMVTVKVVKETSASAYCTYSWENVPANEGYMLRFNESDWPYLPITVSSDTGFLRVRIDPSIPYAEKLIHYVFDVDLLDPEGNVISSDSDTFIFKTKTK